ncbi:TetR family transcriptional regulator [Wenjunlia vitaminophila]|uniref:TetR family transcriptional regulator n=1 Tax=Wenjunlia vitaminophila TaxID=76728 RepID=A0A0T6LT31_WENVI|nr:TetR/AcrR family transcriptional regulator [Wenjunlia vitaminophila]KRV49007.1 TetR family transcriptional regulator [Wenjunlia vitaminophila]
MPKRVDHHARRAEIARALMRVAADRGLEAVSLRHVAQEAGVSSGMVQHYFRTKDEMMTFAMEVVSANVQSRVAAAQDPATPTSPGALVRALLVQLLPLDEPRRADGRLALAFYAYAAVRPAMAEKVRQDTALLHDFVTVQVRAAQAAGDAPADLDPPQAAVELLALVEGLGVQLLGGHYPPQVALDTFHAHLRRLFGPSLEGGPDPAGAGSAPTAAGT